MDSTWISIGGVRVDVVFKDIKNVHLGVYPPKGTVRISAPKRVTMDTLRVFAISKLSWIKQQQRKLREQEREPPREYLNRESHYLWGKRYLLDVDEVDAPPAVELRQGKMRLRVRPGGDRDTRRAVVARWYRDQIKGAVPTLIAKWEPLMGVTVDRFFVQQMKTKWGSSSPGRRYLRFNTDLAKKPRECLEYVVVHEMAHLLERTHNARFVELLDRFMSDWRHRRDQLNQLPLRHEEWAC